MPPTVRRHLLNLLRYGVCALAVWWVLRSLSWVDFKRVVRGAEWQWLVAAWAIQAPIPFFLGVRLRWLLKANEVHLSNGQAIGVTFAGLFANFVLPGQSGGDVVKAVYVARYTDRRHEAATVVFFDRVLGLVCVVALSGVMLLVQWGDPALADWARPIGVAVLVLAVPAVLYFSDWFRRLIRWETLIDTLPLARHLRRVDDAVLAYRGHRWVVLRCMLLTFCLQSVAIFSTYLAGRALGVVGDDQVRSARVYFVYVPLCWIAGALPISPQGLGVLEAAYTQLLHKAAGFGNAEGAAMLSMVTRLINLAWALPGIYYHLRLSRGAAPGPPTSV